jgi:hypothetical protein
MAGHNHFPISVAVDPAPVPLPVHGPDREATYREVCNGISQSLPAPQITTIPARPGKTGSTVRLVVDGRAAVEAWAAYLGAGAVLTHPLPDRSKRVEARLPGWLGWTAIIVTARIAPSGGAR